MKKLFESIIILKLSFLIAVPFSYALDRNEIRRISLKVSKNIEKKFFKDSIQKKKNSPLKKELNKRSFQYVKLLSEQDPSLGSESLRVKAELDLLEQLHIVSTRRLETNRGNYTLNEVESDFVVNNGDNLCNPTGFIGDCNAYEAVPSVNGTEPEFWFSKERVKNLAIPSYFKGCMTEEAILDLYADYLYENPPGEEIRFTMCRLGADEKLSNSGMDIPIRSSVFMPRNAFYPTGLHCQSLDQKYSELANQCDLTSPSDYLKLGLIIVGPILGCGILTSLGICGVAKASGSSNKDACEAGCYCCLGACCPG